MNAPQSDLYAYIALLVENIALWEIMLFVVLIWLARQPDLLKRISHFKFGGLEIEMQALKNEVESSQSQLEELETELQHERRLFGELLDGFDANAPLAELDETRSMLRAHARASGNIDELRDSLNKTCSAEEMYATAVIFRELRPVILIPELSDCLDRLAGQDDLGGIRLNTVWTLTSALHRTLIAAIRDNVAPGVSVAILKRTEQMLTRLELNPRVQADSPERPERGIRGPIKHAREWIKRGLKDAD